MVSRRLTATEVADLIQRFLDHKSLYPQEWNDFVDSSQKDPVMNAYRKRCYDLDALVNRPGTADAIAILELRSIIDELRPR